ncbi:uncharacterized protein A4U43_C09F620 [Asparagus officinalis]|uniref:Uncharacterized protein n=1 Tax=Asparagus officinalis TaxID=4686 RepID=A0A5P1E4J6_ASPOF|nr:uncharacterized protein A4U43_C09F620 [Asparagus officinalis]
MCDNYWGGGQGAGAIVPVPQGGGGGAWGGAYSGGWEQPPSGGRFGAGGGRGGQQQMWECGQRTGALYGSHGVWSSLDATKHHHSSTWSEEDINGGGDDTCGEDMRVRTAVEDMRVGGITHPWRIYRWRIRWRSMSRRFDLSKLKDVPKLAGGVRVGSGQYAKNKLNTIDYSEFNDPAPSSQVGIGIGVGVGGDRYH